MDPAPIPDLPPVPANWRRDRPPRPTVADRPGPQAAVVALLTLLAVVGAIVVFLGWSGRRPAAALVPLWVGDAGGPPLAGRDRDALARGGLFAPGPGDRGGASRAALESRLREVAALPAGQAAVVYVSGRAVCDPAGRVVVLPTDAAPDHPELGLPLRTILEALKADADHRKLLVLDIAWPADDPADALAAGAVPARIPAELDAVEDPNRLVLSSCGPGQVALASEDLGRTVFGFYLEEGLRGWAAPPGAGAVTAKGLARFVQARVRRWAEQNRSARQTPTLFGDAPDFPLVAVRGGRPADHLEPAPPGEYPAWLKDGWATRDRLRGQGADRTDPRRARRLDEALSAAEAAWRGGADPAAVRRQVRDEVARLAEKLDRPPPAGPRPPSLAARAGPPDPPLSAAVRDYLRAAAAAKPEEAAKAGAELAARLRAKPAADAARAVLDAAADEPHLSADAIRRLDDLLRGLDPRPRLIEPALVSRLADAARAATPAEWPATAAARAVAVAQIGERVARPAAFAAAAALLEDAARARFDGESLLLAHGYAPPAAADRHLARAEELYRHALRVQDACEAADAELARAFVVLPAAVRFAAHRPEFADRWQAAAAAARALADARAAAAAARGTDDVLRAAGELEEAARRFAPRFAAVAEPFRAERVKEAVAAAGRPDPTPDDYRALDALLAAPLLTAGERVQVWQAAREVGRRLAAATLAADHDEGQLPAADAVPSYRGEWEADELAERDRRSQEVRAAAALVRLAGLAVPPGLADFADGRAGDVSAEPAARADLAAALRRAWDVSPPPADLGRLDRLARVAPPDAPLPDADEPPAVRLRAAEAAALRDWLAGWYEHAAADPAADGLFAAAALDFRLADRTLPRPPPRPTGDPAGVELTPANRSAVYPVRVELPDGPRPDLAVTALTPAADWLDAAAGTPGPAADRRDGPPAVRVNVTVTLRPGAESAAAAPPRGVLVRVSAGGRSTYLKVPAGLAAVRDRFELFFSPDPKEPTAPTLDVVIRPSVPRQAYYLYARNPGDRPRSVVVELAAGGRLVQAAVKLPPGGTAPVRFPVPPPTVVPVTAPGATPPAGPLPLDDLDGPLVLRVLDADRGNAVVLRREVRPEVLRPAGYVRLASATAHPPGPLTGGKPRVEVVLRAGALVPAAKAELYVAPADPDRPGPPPAGTLRGEIPADGELRLFADGVAAGADGTAWFWVNVDGVDRVFAFRTALPTAGGPVTLRPLGEPALGVSAAAPAGARLPVRVAVDHPPPGATVEVALGRLTAAGLEADAVKTFPTPRQARVGWGVAADGGLLFEAAVRDWVADFDVARIRGRRLLRARLLDPAGAEIRVATAAVVLDDQPAERVSFLDLPKQAKLGARLPVKAAGRAEVAGVKEVQFFLGKPPADGKPPPGGVPGRPLDPDRTTWAADLQLPKDKAGPVEVGARFVTGTGVTAYAAGSVELVEFDPEKVVPGKITGVVWEGTVAQVGLEVVLRDEKGAEKAKAKTGPGGAFAFDPVPPGTYKLTAAKLVSGAAKEAAADVKLAPGGEAKARLDLFLRGR